MTVQLFCQWVFLSSEEEKDILDDFDYLTEEDEEFYF